MLKRVLLIGCDCGSKRFFCHVCDVDNASERFGDPCDEERSRRRLEPKLTAQFQRSYEESCSHRGVLPELEKVLIAVSQS